MKSRFSNKIFSKAIAAVTGAAVFVSAYAPTLASAAEKPEYLSEVFLSYGKTDEEAKSWLEKNGYTVLDQDLNQGTSAGVSWLGLGNEKRCVYLGYKTTDNSENAIRDMRVMNMNGEYSYDEYEKLLESKKAEINSFVSDMKSALAEYRTNYEKGSIKAKLAHDKMNKLLDDDCGYSALGDLLLKPIKEEMTEEEYEKAPKEHVDMTTLVMQGNVNNVSTLMSDLCMAADTSETGWLSRLADFGGFDDLYGRYEKEYPALPESRLNALLKSNYDEQAVIAAEKLADLSESLKVYTECPVNADSTEAEIETYFKEHPEESEADWLIAGSEYLLLTETKYEGSSLAELVTGTKYDFSDPDDRAVLYPLIDAMSEGQRALLSYVDIGEMLINGSLDDDGWKETCEKAEKTLESIGDSSVYLGVDRSCFEPAGIALTSEARRIQSATGANYSQRLFGENSSYLEIAGITAGIILIGAGMVSLSHSGSLKNVADNLTLVLNSDLVYVEKATDKVANDFVSYLISQGFDTIDIYKLDVTDQVLNKSIFNMFDPAQNPLGEEFFALKNDDVIGRYIDSKTIFNDFRNNNETTTNSLAEYYSAWDNSVSKQTEHLKSNNKTLIENFNKSSQAWKTAGVILCIAGTLLAIGSAAAAVYDLYKYYHQDYAPIPRRIVHESTDEKGRFVYTAYNCTLCNREAQGFGNDKLGAYGDMNGDVGKQWLALYTTKDKAAGDPITADMIAQKGSNKFPAGMSTTIRLFGQTDSLNITSEEYGFKDGLGGLYIFSGTVNEDAPSAAAPESAADKDKSSAETVSEPETASSSAAPAEESSASEKTTAAGSVVGTGVMVGSCVGSAAIGALICFLIIRRKREIAA